MLSANNIYLFFVMSNEIIAKSNVLCSRRNSLLIVLYGTAYIS